MRKEAHFVKSLWFKDEWLTMWSSRCWQPNGSSLRVLVSPTTLVTSLLDRSG